MSTKTEGVRTSNETSVNTSKNQNSVEPVEDLTPSADFDIKDVPEKPTSRKPLEPAFRGWKEVGRWEVSDALTQEDELDDLSTKSTMFDQYLPAILYGDWYHNAGYIIAAGLLSWITGWFGLSVAPLFFIMSIFVLLYRTSIRKYRSLIREQVQREFSIKAIEDDYETFDWYNTFLDKYWIYLEPSISQIICEQVNPILATSPAPGFIKALWIDHFTAGTKPFRINRVKTLHGTDPDIVVMDWGVSMYPNSLADASNKQMKNKVNQKAIVKASLFGLTVPIAISDVAFDVLVRVRLRMMTSFPHVETVNISLLEAPKFDFVSKILLGDNVFNWEVLAIPGLYPFINQMIKKYVGTLIYSPLSFQLNLQQLMTGNSLDSAIGILAIKVKGAKEIRGHSTAGNTLDPYLNIGFKKKVLAKTEYKENTANPVWNQTLYIPVKSLSEPLHISCVDYNHHRKDREVGNIQFDIEPLIKKPKQDNITASFFRNSKTVGHLTFDLEFMHTIEPIYGVDGAVTPPPDLNTGIAKIEIVEARHIVGDVKKMKLSVDLFIDNEHKLSTATKGKSDNPYWGENYEAIVFNRTKTKVRIVLKNDNKKIGQIMCTLNNLLDASQVDESWFPFAKGGEIKLQTSWKPVGLTDASGSGDFTPPIGVVRVEIEKAEDLRNLERVGKVDPYCKLLVNNVEKARTIAISSNLNPIWNEIHYVAVTSVNQKLTFDVMDVESHSPDRTLGNFETKLSEIINRDENGKYITWVDNEKRENKLIHKKGPKGTVSYKLSFYPVIPVKTLEEIQDEKDVEEAERKRQQEEEEKKQKGEKIEKKDKKKEKEVEEEQEEDEEFDKFMNSGKVELSVEELCEHNSGVLVMELYDGTVSKDDVYLHIFTGNNGYHSYVSSKITKKQVKINTSFETIITELDWNKTTFILSKNKDHTRLDKEVIAQATIPTMQLLKNAYYKPSTIQLNGAGNASFKIQTQWFPIIFENGVPIQDSYKNSGILTAEAIRAENLPAGDRNGKSDPYVKLYLNNDKDHFFKSKKIKKTLNPSWKESCTVEVYNLVDSFIRVEVFDWDIGPEQDDFLGMATISLGDYDPANNNDEIEVDLEGEDGQNAGKAWFKFSFEVADVINVKKKATENFDTFNDTVGGGVAKVGGGVAKVGSAGKGVVGGGAKLLKKGLHLGRSKD